MAPDLNSVPPSPRPISQQSPRVTGTPSSRRASQQMPSPPTVPLSPPVPNILPSNTNAFMATSQPAGAQATTAFPTFPADNTGVGTGPGPLRHPRPLTAADIHLQLEKEQEAVVNRLTRELSLLRAAQNASVVSNTSSTSERAGGLPDASDHHSNHLLSGPSHPVPSTRRHHRSSSAASARSIAAASAASTTAGVAGSLASVYAPSTSERTRGTLPRHDSTTQSLSLSRQNSITSSRRSGASSPVPPLISSGSYQHSEFATHTYPLRPSFSSQHRELSGGYVPQVPSADGQPITSVQTTGRYEEAAYHRHELEAVKRENDALKQKIRDLERLVREGRRAREDESRTRSESVSTSASGVLRGRDAERVVGTIEVDEVRVGESASGGGLA
ncbi:hypothetical protein V500_07702 [Pseudogymnoascus sp. VKM F-4518 (FW-2643)]|nr:hypothetical protein V500_07702 [Pseudogymnoascus sp. VKM F-4518 (FW-2643)]